MGMSALHVSPNHFLYAHETDTNGNPPVCFVSIMVDPTTPYHRHHQEFLLNIGFLSNKEESWKHRITLGRIARNCCVIAGTRL